MKYYRLKDDLVYSGRWYLGDILGIDNWELVSGIPPCCSDINLEIDIFKDGDEMDITLSEVYGIPIVSEKVRVELLCFPEVIFVPLMLNKEDCQTAYYAMVVKEKIECVDESSSQFQKFETNDPVRPDKAGEYRGFMTLRVNPHYIKGLDIIRIKKFEAAIIISDRVKEKIESIGATGVSFLPVV